jgi:hypothetical protein
MEETLRGTSIRTTALPILVITGVLAWMHPTSARPSPATNDAQHSDSSRPIRLSVDATHAPQKILHAKEVIPVQSGDLTLY